MSEKFEDVPWAESGSRATSVMPDGKTLDVYPSIGAFRAKVWKADPRSHLDIISSEGGLRNKDEAKECAYKMWKVSNGEKP